MDLTRKMKLLKTQKTDGEYYVDLFVFKKYSLVSLTFYKSVFRTPFSLLLQLGGDSIVEFSMCLCGYGFSKIIWCKL